MIDKNNPTPDWIASMRKRFPCETEIDRILTRKLERRAGPPYEPLSLDTLCAGVESLLRTELDDEFHVCDPHWLAGGASKLQMAFTLDWNQPGPGGKRRQRTPMVLRMEPAESIVETSRLREFQIIRALRDVVPVPPVYWVDVEGTHLPYPAMIYGFAQGVTKPPNAKSGVTGMGTHLEPAVRERLAPQFVAHLAAIHNFDFRAADLSAFDVPAPGTQAAQWTLNWWERVWEEDVDEDIPLLRLAAAWLRRNMPSADAVCVVHADYRIGNVLFDETSYQITAWLDWEIARIGDRHLDLAWTTGRAFGSLAEDGKTFLVCSLLPENDFLAAYEKASGLSVDPKKVHYYKIFNTYMQCVLLFATGYRAARNGKTHQDVFITWLMGIGYMQMDELRELLTAA